jgi:membrane protein
VRLREVPAALERLYIRLDRRLGGWLSMIVRSVLAFDQDEGPLMARSISYFALFAIFPALLALIVIASTVLESNEVKQAVMTLVSQYMPITQDVVAANIEQLLAARETVSLIALIGLIWSATGVFRAIFQAVNRAWGISSSTLGLWNNVYGLGMIAAVGAFLLLAMLIGPIVDVVRALQAAAGGQPADAASAGPIVSLLLAVAPVLLPVGAFMVMYKALPRTRVRWSDVWLGGLVAGLVWQVGQQVFSWYLSNAADYNVIYGSVGAIIGLLVWAYLSAQILLLGAEFTAEYSRWQRLGRPLEPRPLREWLTGWTPARETGQSAHKSE